MAEESSTKAPVILPTYTLGTEGKPHHFAATTTREAAAIEAKSLNVNDAAFIKRSDLKWTYAIVIEKVEGGVDAAAGVVGDGKTILRFEVDKDKNRKSFPENQWGKYIRVIKVEDEELAKLKVEEDAAKNEDEEAKPEGEAKDESKKEDGTPAKVGSSASVGGESAASNKSNKSNTSWFAGAMSGAVTGAVGSLFGGSAKTEANVPAAVQEETAEETAASVADAQPAVESAPESAPLPTSTATITSQDTPAPFAAAELSSATPPPAPVETSAASAAPSQGTFAVETPIEKHVIAAESVKEEEPVESASAATPALTVNTKEEEQSEPDNTKENSEPSEREPIKLTQPPTFLPSPKPNDSVQQSKAATEPVPASTDKISALRSPLSSLKQPVTLKKKSSIVNKFFGKKKDKVDPSSSPILSDKKVLITSPRASAKNAVALGADPKSPKSTKKAPAENVKEWFDPEACEVDYDKNPTDLFQALEARQFTYANEMFQQVNRQFTKQCRTWVVARGHKKKDSHQLRFRALPLHAALVFGAPDDITKKILNAYPKATRGRDVKGRLPIHLALEHDASEEIVSLILEAFPKGFFAKDKKDMEAIDYINGNMARSHMKKYVPLIVAAKVEDERIKWQAELEAELEAQKLTLKTDTEYMAEVIESITDTVETNCANKMELLDTNYQKEILLLKKKHDSETHALLEGFEVKLNFERKLQKLKGVKA